MRDTLWKWEKWIQNYSRKSDFEAEVKLNRVKSRGVGKKQKVGREGANFFKNEKVEGQTFRPKSEIKRYILIFVVRFKKKPSKSVGACPGSYAPEVWLQINITANSIDTCSLSIESEPKDMQYAYEIICFR